MGVCCIEQEDILKDYENTLEEYDIETIELESDPDLKRINEIMKEFNEENK